LTLAGARITLLVVAAKVSDRELDVMKALWALGREASVSEIHERMSADGSRLAFTTVQTMLNRLSVKGQVRRRLDGRAYRYVAAVKAPAAAKQALRSLVDRFFAGSAAGLAAHLVEEEMSEKELRRVEELLEQRRKSRR
jgi:BlaI family transcriptional regulator, penicillinase repressor